MGIQNLLNEKLINDDLKSENKYQVIEELLDLLVAQNKVTDRDACLRDLIEREQFLSTGLEHGAAVPHAKTAAVTELMVSFGISRQGLDFSCLDGKPAHFIFLLVSPLNTAGPHIQMLAQISRNFKNEDAGKKIMAAENSQEIMQIINDFS
jgi:fructose-specific phosphotransferase system IIA component